MLVYQRCQPYLSKGGWRNVGVPALTRLAERRGWARCSLPCASAGVRPLGSGKRVLPMQRASSGYQNNARRMEIGDRWGNPHLWGHVGRIEGAPPVLHAHLWVHRAPVAGPDW